MKRIKYLGPADVRSISDEDVSERIGSPYGGGFEVRRGGTIEVVDDIADFMLEKESASWSLSDDEVAEPDASGDDADDSGGAADET